MNSAVGPILKLHLLNSILAGPVNTALDTRKRKCKKNSSLTHTTYLRNVIKYQLIELQDSSQNFIAWITKFVQHL